MNLTLSQQQAIAQCARDLGLVVIRPATLAEGGEAKPPRIAVKVVDVYGNESTVVRELA